MELTNRSNRSKRVIVTALIIGLFVALTPGVLLTLPPNSPKLVVAVVHGLVFALAYHFIYMPVWRAVYEGFQSAPPSAVAIQQKMDIQTAKGLPVGFGFGPRSFDTARGPGNP
jgi:hypothetical protein